MTQKTIEILNYIFSRMMIIQNLYLLFYMVVVVVRLSYLSASELYRPGDRQVIANFCG
jgi:hypothetical protein